MLLAIQGGDMLAFLRAAHDDVAALHHIQVKGVHGVAGFQHDEVGDVHHVVDGAHASAVEVLAQPHGAGADTHVLDHPGDIAGAQVGSLNVHLHIVVDIAARLGHSDFGLVEGGAAGHSGLPCNAPHAQTVGAVGQHLEIHDGVVNAQDGLHIRAEGMLLLELKDARRAHGRVQFHRHAQLLGGAEHAFGHLSAHLALLDLHAAGQVRAVERHRGQHARAAVGRAADDVQGLLAAHIHHGAVQVVGVGVIHTGQHLANHHVVDLAAELLIPLDAVPDHNHLILIFLR